MERITLSHGDGGACFANLLHSLILKKLGNPILNKLADAAILPRADGPLAFTTDSFVIRPIFFPGGDIGKLAVCGTVNDLTAAGAKPLYLSASFILEEGMPLPQLEQIISSVADTARQCGVLVVCGDTKVVPRGQADNLYLNTAGVGELRQNLDTGAERVREGDVILISGFLGDHGLAVLSSREGFNFQTPVISDCAPLHSLLDILEPYYGSIRWMRDPTRGGLAAALNELAATSGYGIRLNEGPIPIRPEVEAACGLLGLNPLTLANEGKMIIVAAPQAAMKILAVLRAHPVGKNAAIIGILENGPPQVLLRTTSGGTRRVDMPSGPPIPRIC
jgi:hydrogenase expression/formation protein HypE